MSTGNNNPAPPALTPAIDANHLRALVESLVLEPSRLEEATWALNLACHTHALERFLSTFDVTTIRHLLGATRSHHPEWFEASS